MNIYKTELKWGLIFAASGLIWMALERLAGLHDTYISQHAFYTNFYAIIAIALYVFALKEKREKDLGGAMTYAEGFSCGLIMTLVITILSPVSQYITATIISPDYFPNVINFVVESDQMTREVAEENFNLYNYILLSVIAAPVMGLITSAIVAAFMRRKAQ